MESSFVLIIGGGQDTLFLIEQVKSLGFNTIVVDRNEKAPAAKIADEHLCLSTRESTPIISSVQGKRIDACLTRSSGQAVVCWAEVCRALGFPSPEPNLVMELSGKLSLHQMNDRLGIATPTTQTYDEWKSDARITPPLIVKPEWETTGKKGVVLVKKAHAMDAAVEFTSQYLSRGSVLVQEFLAGRDISVLGVCLAGQYFPYALLEERNEFNETRNVHHSGFFQIDEDPALSEIMEIADRLCEQEVFGYSPLNINFRVVGQKAYLMECNLDFGGEGVLEALFDRDPSSNIIKMYLQTFINRENENKYMDMWDRLSDKYLSTNKEI